MTARGGACASTTATNATARFLVDATGRGAVLARQNGVAFENLDRLVGSVMLFEQAADDGVGLLIETFPRRLVVHGGAARRPAHRRRDERCRSGPLARISNRLDGFMRALGATQHCAAPRRGARPLGSPALRPAGSRHIIARHRRCRCCASAMRPRASIRCRGRASSRRCARAFSPRMRSAIFSARDDDSGVEPLSAVHRR